MHAGPDGGEPVAAHGVGAADGRGLRGEAAAVVADVEDHPVVEVGQGQPGGGGPGVLPHIGQGPLGDAQQGGLHPVRQRGARGALHMAVDGERALRLGALAGRQRFQGRLQAAALGQVGRGQVVDEAAGLGEVAFRDAGGRTHMAAGGVRIGAPGAVGRLEQHLLAGQALGQGVVDLHGEPLALGEGSLAPLGGGQFAPGAQQVVDQLALASGQFPLAYRLTPHMDEDGGSHGGDGGRGQDQIRVEPFGQPQLGGHDERGEQGDQGEGRARRQDAQPGVEQRHRAPREARREDDQHHPDEDEHPQPDEPAAGWGANPGRAPGGTAPPG